MTVLVAALIHHTGQTAGCGSVTTPRAGPASDGAANQRAVGACSWPSFLSGSESLGWGPVRVVWHRQSAGGPRSRMCSSPFYFLRFRWNAPPGSVLLPAQLWKRLHAYRVHGAILDKSLGPGHEQELHIHCQRTDRVSVAAATCKRAGRQSHEARMHCKGLDASVCERCLSCTSCARRSETANGVATSCASLLRHQSLCEACALSRRQPPRHNVNPLLATRTKGAPSAVCSHGKVRPDHAPRSPVRVRQDAQFCSTHRRVATAFVTHLPLSPIQHRRCVPSVALLRCEHQGCRW